MARGHTPPPLCGRRPRPRMRKKQNDRRAAGLAGQNQAPGCREIHVIQLGDNSREVCRPSALFNRSQRIHAGAGLHQEKLSGVHTRMPQPATTRPPMLRRQGLLDHPQARPTSSGIPQSRQRQPCQGREIPIAGLRQLMQARPTQPEREGQVRCRIGGMMDGTRNHCSVFVPSPERVKRPPSEGRQPGR